jgi:hypothetical protein
MSHCKEKVYLQGKVVCPLAFCHYFGMSQYQYYTAIKCVEMGVIPPSEHGNHFRDYNRTKQELCGAYLKRICTELAEDLPTGFRLELSKRVLFLLSCLYCR